LIDWIKYAAVKSIFALFGAVPHRLCVAIFGWLWWIAILSVPRLRNTARINLQIAFPEKDLAARRALLRKKEQRVRELC
jgi:lauroyl/myristoyl acyltransferase